MTLRKEMKSTDMDPVSVDKCDNEVSDEESQQDEGETTRHPATFVISPPEDPEPEPDPDPIPDPECVSSAPSPWSFRRTPSAASDLESVSSYYMEMSRRVSSVCFGF